MLLGAFGPTRQHGGASPAVASPAMAIFIAKWTMAARQFFHEVRTTLTGKLVLLYVILAIPFALSYLTGDNEVFGVFGPHQELQLLRVANVVLLVVTCVSVFAALAMQVANFQDSEPLMHFPGAVPALAAYVLLVPGIGASILVLGIVHAVVYGRLLVSHASGRLEPILATGSILVLLLTLLGLVSAGAFRAVVLRAGARFNLWGLRASAGLAGVLAFLSLMAVPGIVVSYGGEALAANIASLDFVTPLVQWVVSGSWTRWPLVIVPQVALVTVALVYTRTWLGTAQADLTLDFVPYDVAPRSNVMGSGLGSRLQGGVGVLMLKDLLGASHRSVAIFVTRLLLQGVVFMFVAALWIVGVSRFPLLDSLQDIVMLGLAGFMPFVLGFVHGLPSVGGEGSMLATLRPVLSWRELYVAKLASNTTVIAVQTAGFVMLALAGAWILGYPVMHSWWSVMVAAWGTAIAALGSTAAAFWFPDFRPTRGVTRVGHFFYVSCSFMSYALLEVVGITGLTRWDDMSTFAGALTLLSLLVIAVAGGMGLLGAKRLGESEI